MSYQERRVKYFLHLFCTLEKRDMEKYLENITFSYCKHYLTMVIYLHES